MGRHVDLIPIRFGLALRPTPKSDVLKRAPPIAPAYEIETGIVQRSSDGRPKPIRVKDRVARDLFAVAESRNSDSLWINNAAPVQLVDRSLYRSGGSRPIQNLVLKTGRSDIAWPSRVEAQNSEAFRCIHLYRILIARRAPQEIVAAPVRRDDEGISSARSVLE